MHVAATIERGLDTDADTIIRGVFEDEAGSAEDLEPELQALLESGEGGRAFKRLALTHRQGRRLILAGLGPRAAFDAERARVVAGLAQRRARQCRARTVCWDLPVGAGRAIAEGLVQGTVLSAYRFTRYRPPCAEEPATVARLILSGPAEVAPAVHRAGLIAAAQNRARDLANTPANDLTPAALADYARALAGRHEALEVTILDGEAIRRAGMGAFAAVARGSSHDARLISLRYEGGRADAPRLALIGKAVTFDSGGLSIKPPASMIDMKFDMCGGAAVLESLSALAELEAPGRVLGVIGAAENMVGGDAVRPSDIVTALDGTTIEIDNTDAEGRLVLADCMTHARREGCAAMVDVATLTGAVKIALGTTHAGLMANHDGLAEQVGRAARRTGELVWRLPLHPAYAELVRGRYAQLTNRPQRREASSITAAEFLHHFAGDLPWAHLDIAAVADGDHVPYQERGGTGFGVRLLIDLAIGFAA